MKYSGPSLLYMINRAASENCIHTRKDCAKSAKKNVNEFEKLSEIIRRVVLSNFKAKR